MGEGAAETSRIPSGKAPAQNAIGAPHRLR